MLVASLTIEGRGRGLCPASARQHHRGVHHPDELEHEERPSALAGEIAHTSKSDWDNMAKAILDAGNTII
jgi:Holliday junction resolvase RusA-like endonuclease